MDILAKAQSGDRKEIPIGVVSKNDIGDRKTALSAALKRFKLATKLTTLCNVDEVNKAITVEPLSNSRKGKAEKEHKNSLRHT